MNNRLSVGRQVQSRRIDRDTITGLPLIGGLVLDRERTHNRYYLVNNATNNGLEIVTTSAGLPSSSASQTDALSAVSSFQDRPDSS